MSKTLFISSAILGALLVCTFLVNYTWSVTEQNSLFSNLLNFSILGFSLFIYFREKSLQSLTYSKIIIHSAFLALVAGALFSMFFIVYVNFIQPSYFEELAISQMEKMKKEGADENMIRKTLRIIGVAQRYHIKELSIIISTLVRSLILSLVLGPFFITKDEKKI